MSQILIIPENSSIDPFVQIMFLAKSYTVHFRKKKSEGYKIAVSKFCLFLKSNGDLIGYSFPAPFDLNVYVTETITSSFRIFLEKEVLEKKIIAETASNYLSHINRLFAYAYDNRWVKIKALEASLPYSVDGRLGYYDSYSVSEQDRINEALKLELAFIHRLRSRYVKRNVGSDPCLSGWHNLENCIWFFENRMECSPIPATNKNQQKYKKFFNAVCNHHGGISSFYRRLGLTDLIDHLVIGPLLFSLAAETGLNPSSLFSLKLDCLGENAMDGSISIKFTKNRSGGEQSITIDEYDENQEIVEIKRKQIYIIKKLIGDCLELTSLIRAKAPENLKDSLFIYENRSNPSFGEVKVMDGKGVYTFAEYLQNKYRLKTDEDEPLELWLVRFRSTAISKMFYQGRNAFEIQATAVHKSIVETMRYTRRKNLELSLQKDTFNGLQLVLSNAQTGISRAEESIAQTPGKLYKGVVCDCLNVYDPPDEVRKLKNYQKGQACSWFNICLTCHNVIITKFHLPTLFVYRDQIAFSEAFKNKEVPTYHIYQRTLSVLESILDPAQSEFSKEDLDLARMKAEQNRAEFIDPLFYTPTLDYIK